MKFARRAEGIKSGRSIFKKAREDLRTRHHVYVTAALMEYYCSKVTSAPLVCYNDTTVQKFGAGKILKKKSFMLRKAAFI